MHVTEHKGISFPHKIEGYIIMIDPETGEELRRDLYISDAIIAMEGGTSPKEETIAYEAAKKARELYRSMIYKRTKLLPENERGPAFYATLAGGTVHAMHPGERKVDAS